MRKDMLSGNMIDVLKLIHIIEENVAQFNVHRR